MWTFLARQFRIFALGFIVAAAITLYFRVGTADLLITLAVGAAAGVLLTIGLSWLERRFPDETPPNVGG